MANKNASVKNDYTVEIIESSKELTKRESIMLKDVSNAVKLDEAINDTEATLVIAPAAYAILSIHNGKSKNNPDYYNYIIIDTNNNKYVTGSPSFWNAFLNIWNEMKDEESGWQIECYKRDSKNYNGKQFITCSII